MNESYGAIWVCRNCMLHHTNGECDDCYETEGYYGAELDHDPLSLITSNWFITGPDGEPDTFGTAPCQGCGSWLHGERHAMTLWKD
jgi:hypothetical protein